MYQSYIIVVVLFLSKGITNEINNCTGNCLKTFCYVTSWSNVLETVEARFEIQDINATLCSHIIYAFANIDSESFKLIKSQAGDDNGELVNKQGRYFDLNKLKKNYPHLVTLLSVGGQAAESKGFAQVVNSPENMKSFSRNVAIYLRDRDFDGIDIDWEWPGDIYKDKFTSMLQVMREEFQKDAVQRNKPPLKITIAVAVGAETIVTSYNITEITKVVDYIQLMAYDFHGTWSKKTSFSDPLFSRASNIEFNQALSQAWAVDHWISKGAKPEKLVMGVTGVATTFALKNKTNIGVGAPVLGPGQNDSYLKQPGHITYYKVCDLRRQKYTEKWDDEQKMAYMFSDDQWVGYNDATSIKEKVNFAYSRQLAGMMFWTLPMDDFHGKFCNAGKFPLMTAMYNAIQEYIPPAQKHSTVNNVITSTTPLTIIDFQVNHKTRKNGINTYNYNKGVALNGLNCVILFSLLLKLIT